MKQRLVWNFEFVPQNRALAQLPVANPLPEDSVYSESAKIGWEIRYFWPLDQIISLALIDPALLHLSLYKQKSKEDYYYLIPEASYNLKLRRKELVYKPLLQQAAKAQGFGPKIKLHNLEPGTVLPAELLMISKQLDLLKGILVKKESFTYRFATVPPIKLELARLEVAGQVHFSLCIQGKSLTLVTQIDKQLQLGKQSPCDYVHFLKQIDL